MTEPEANLLRGDCRYVLPLLKESSVSFVVADPPYNYEVIGKDWNHKEIQRRLERIKTSSTLVKNIPYGNSLSGGVRNARWYVRNHNNNLQYTEWTKEWGKGLMHVCKDGAIISIFSSVRSLTHIQVGPESVGFYTRDILVYRRNSGIPRGLNIQKKMLKMGDVQAND